MAVLALLPACLTVAWAVDQPARSRVTHAHFNVAIGGIPVWMACSVWVGLGLFALRAAHRRPRVRWRLVWGAARLLAGASAGVALCHALLPTAPSALAYVPHLLCGHAAAELAAVGVVQWQKLAAWLRLPASISCVDDLAPEWRWFDKNPTVAWLDERFGRLALTLMVVAAVNAGAYAGAGGASLPRALMLACSAIVGAALCLPSRHGRRLAGGAGAGAGAGAFAVPQFGQDALSPTRGPLLPA